MFNHNEIDEQCEREGEYIYRAKAWSHKSTAKVSSKISKFAAHIPLKIKKERSKKNLVDSNKK